jgi:hypothetical protein
MMKLRSGKVIGCSNVPIINVNRSPTPVISSCIMPNSCMSSSLGYQIEANANVELINPYRNYPTLTPSQVKQEEVD